MQIISSGGNIATADDLARLRLATDETGVRIYPRYKDGRDEQRLSWLNKQFFGLALIAHQTVDPTTIKVDLFTLDKEIMDHSVLRELTLVEMQEAFRRGIFKEYGEYYGLTAVSLIGFLKGFVRSDKKVAASSIIYKLEARKEQEANARFFRELYQAEKEGKIEVPDFSENRINGPQAKKTYTDEELAAHREKIRQQAEMIRRQAGKEGGDER